MHRNPFYNTEKYKKGYWLPVPVNHVFAGNNVYNVVVLCYIVTSIITATNTTNVANDTSITLAPNAKRLSDSQTTYSESPQKAHISEMWVFFLSAFRILTVYHTVLSSVIKNLDWVWLENGR
jgi:hypothetical protein